MEVKVRMKSLENQMKRTVTKDYITANFRLSTSNAKSARIIHSVEKDIFGNSTKKSLNYKQLKRLSSVQKDNYLTKILKEDKKMKEYIKNGNNKNKLKKE